MESFKNVHIDPFLSKTKTYNYNTFDFLLDVHTFGRLNFGIFRCCKKASGPYNYTKFQPCNLKKIKTLCEKDA